MVSDTVQTILDAEKAASEKTESCKKQCADEIAKAMDAGAMHKNELIAQAKEKIEEQKKADETFFASLEAQTEELIAQDARQLQEQIEANKESALKKAMDLLLA